MNKFALVVLSLMLAPVTLVHATPLLGVATDEYSYTGTSKPTDSYLADFGVTGASMYPCSKFGNNEGFVVNDNWIEPFYNPNNGKANKATDTIPNIYLFLSKATPLANNETPSVTVSDEALVKSPLRKFESYKNLYWIDTPLTLVFDSKLKYWDRQMFYTGTLSAGDYFFLVADDNGTSGIQFCNGAHDTASPKTTSALGNGYTAIPVPEPASLSLLGIGLLGMISLKLKRK